MRNLILIGALCLASVSAQSIIATNLSSNSTKPENGTEKPGSVTILPISPIAPPPPAPPTNGPKPNIPTKALAKIVFADLSLDVPVKDQLDKKTQHVTYAWDLSKNSYSETWFTNPGLVSY